MSGDLPRAATAFDARAPRDADYEVACWRCNPPTAADVYVRIVRNEGNPHKTTKRHGSCLCQSHLEEFRDDDEIDVQVLESETRAVRGANQSRSLEDFATEKEEN